MTPLPQQIIPGRGPVINPANRFERINVEADPEWLNTEMTENGAPPSPATRFYFDGTESLLTPNDSPDVGPGWGLIW